MNLDAMALLALSVLAGIYLVYWAEARRASAPCRSRDCHDS